MKKIYLGHKKSINKYRNIYTEVDGITFHSKAEAARYQQLKLLERALEICNLTLQPSFSIELNGIPICKYKADFSYYDKVKRKNIIEDVKGVRTPLYRLKKRLVEAQHGIMVVEI